MKLPVRIFSDLHLGHRASVIQEVESLRGLIAGAGTVILNGDTWEELAEPWREYSIEMLEELKRIAEQERCDLIFVRGNHDPNFTDVNYVELAGGRIVITHGDALLRYSSPWKREVLEGRKDLEEIWRKYPEAVWDRESRFRVAEGIARDFPSKTYTRKRSLFSRCCDALLPPGRALRMLDAWGNQGRYSVRFCETYFPKAEILIVGHLHCATVRSMGSKTMINSGSFVRPSVAYGAEWDGSYLRVSRIFKSKSGFRMEEASGLWKVV